MTKKKEIFLYLKEIFPFYTTDFKAVINYKEMNYVNLIKEITFKNKHMFIF